MYALEIEQAMKEFTEHILIKVTPMSLDGHCKVFVDVLCKQSIVYYQTELIVNTSYTVAKLARLIMYR